MSQTPVQVFSSTDALSFGWTKTKEHLNPLLKLGAIGVLLALLQQALTGNAPQNPLSSLLSVVMQVFQLALTLVYVRVALKIVDDLPVQLSRPAEWLGDFFSFLLTSVLYGLIVAGGFILLVVPGVIWAIQFGFSGYLVVDKKLDPIAALKASARLTRGVKGPLFGFGLLVLLTNLVGALALGVGLLVTIPMTAIAAAYVLRRLQARSTTLLKPEEKPLVAPPGATPAPSH